MTAHDSRPAKRVLYLLGPGELAGIQRHVQELARCLPKAFEPHVAVMFAKGEGSRQIAADGIPVYVLGCRSGHDPRLALRLLRLIKGLRPALVHQHENHLIPVVTSSRWGRVPLIHTEHCPLRGHTQFWKTRLLYRLLQRRVDRIIAVSEATRLSLVREARVAPGITEMVPNGIDLGASIQVADLRAELGLSPATTLIGSVGRLAPGKCVDTLVRVASLVALARKNVHVVIAGDGPHRGLLQAAIRESAVSHQFHWLGERIDGRGVIAGLDLLVLTSAYETGPRTALEAFAEGTVVTGFVPEGGFGEVLEAAGDRPVAAVSWVREEEALAKVIVELVDHPDRRTSLAKAARNLVESCFDMRRLAGRIASIYDTVIREKEL